MTEEPRDGDVELEGFLLAESEKAYRIRFIGTPSDSGETTCWVPKSQIVIDELGPDKMTQVFMPQWLAEAKELI